MSNTSDTQLADFCSITGVNDIDSARQYLTVSDGDLQQAISLYFEGGQASAASQITPNERQPIAEAVN
ncbi:UBX domain protein Ubx2 [Entomophthora muscae]|uniref:UBX domain protein Ubx2 n=1 Tax=Entomophthora muscae TaxID=34485 RepID=A0ACC2UJ22_9FUNG|nr:UBX domain protein Ubx2 [Entomophthora muscae]